MADGTKIEWTDATWTPIRARNKTSGKVGWHCEHASPGCINCYSEDLNEKRFGTGLPFKPGHRGDVDHFLDDAMLTQPLRWRRPRMVFVCSMTDLFGDWVPDEWIDRIFAVMALAPQHTFQVLTKRPERMRDYLRVRAGDFMLHWPDAARQAGATLLDCQSVKELRFPLPNVWLGVSVEDQRRADERIPALLDTPAAVRWVSAEPLLGPVDVRPWIPTCYECGASCGLRLPGIPEIERCTKCGEECGPDTEPVLSEGCPKCSGELEPVCPDCGHYMVYQHPDTPNIDWIVVGGESGHGARPMHPDWARAIRDQCAEAEVPFLFKQWGRFRPQHDDPEDRYFASAPAAFEDCAIDAGWRFGRSPTQRPWMMFDVGKKAAGRLLDGVQHDGYPPADEIIF